MKSQEEIMKIVCKRIILLNENDSETNVRKYQ